MAARQQLPPSQYTVGWVSALPVELATAQALLDETHEIPASSPFETNIYTLGKIAGHNVVLAALPYSRIGPSLAAWETAQMKNAFPNLQFVLMVGIGGGVPQSGSGTDVRLGDVVVGKSNQAHGGVVQYDSGKVTMGGFQRTGFLNSPPTVLLNGITELEARRFREQLPFLKALSEISRLKEFRRETAGPDALFEAHYDHAGSDTCGRCDNTHLVNRIPREKDVAVHYGSIASGNKVIKSARERDQLSAELGGVMCFEMEAAGLMNDSPCLVVRGICDYADSHKNKRWQPYAAGTAAAYAKALLSVVPPLRVPEAGKEPDQSALRSRVMKRCFGGYGISWSRKRALNCSTPQNVAND
ncbi:nucleoside phosphorylase domain-containing protein [Aspergillus heterothallicus]